MKHKKEKIDLNKEKIKKDEKEINKKIHIKSTNSTMYFALKKAGLVK